MCVSRILLLFVLAISSILPLAESLSGAHVCTRIENQTLTIRESYTEPVIVQTFTWCLQVPPRCKKTRFEDRIRYRIKTIVEKKKISECCEGYVIQKDSDVAVEAERKCVPFCKSCKNGICLKPNFCQCEPGYEGDNCAHECPPGSWGRKCIHRCDCASGGSCDSVTGICECPAGWQGPGCKESCSPRRWGPRCESTCDCGPEYVSCDPETGKCLVGRTADADISLARNWTGDDLFRAIPVSGLVTEGSSTNPTAETKYNDWVTETGVTNVDDDSWTSETKGSDVPGFQNTTKQPEDDILGTVSELSENVNSVKPESTITNHDGSSSTTSSNDLTQFDDAISNTFAKSGLSNTPKLTDEIFYDNRNNDFESEAKTVGPPHPSYVKTLQKVIFVSAEQVPQIQHDTTVLIVVGSVVSLCLTTLAALMVFYLRSKVLESVPLSIYSGDNKNDGDQDKQNTIRSLKITSTTLPPLPTFVNPVFAANPESALITFDAAELNKHYDNRTGTINIRVSGNIRDLLESHYDRPPATTCRHTMEQNTEHVYDEIPLTVPLCIRKE